MDDREFENWASAYIEAQENAEAVDEHHPLWWAVMRFFELEQNDPESCWAAILKILSKDPPDKVLSVLAAGPLEDLISEHGPLFIERIEEGSRKDPAFRHLLGGVWKSTSSPEIWSRIETIRGKPW